MAKSSRTKTGAAPRTETGARPRRSRPRVVASTPPAQFIVGIGASAGGLEALDKFFSSTPADSGLAFVVVQHLSPDYKSFMVELLSKRTRVPVLGAQDGLEVKPNHIYLIPPRKNLKIFQGRLLLVDPDLARGFNLPIDVFFRSLAEEKQQHAIGVVLSGTGSDGTMGVRAIKDAGGMVMVQSEATAQFDGMPRSAIGTGLADFILPPEEMPRQLLQYLQHPFVAKEKAIHRDQSSTDTLMHKVFALLREKSGVDFSLYKPSTIDRRIERRISINQLSNLDEYYQYLQASPREAGLLFNELLICVTRFFRDRESFDFVESTVIPELLKRLPTGETARVWVPSCSTGEEAYSLAMLFLEEMRRQERHWNVKIFATDISKQAIESASQGLYSESEVADVPPDKLRRYFVKKADGWQVNQLLRQMVVFARQDLLKDPPFTKLDMISCRNVLIYFQPVLQTRVMGLFHFALKPDGALFLGSSETVGDLADSFNTVSTRHKVYQTRGVGRGPIVLHAPELDRGWPEPARLLRHQPGGDARLVDAVHQEVIGDYVPPCLVVDENGDVIHLLGAAGDYLRAPAGNFTRNVLKLTAHNLSVALATLMHRVDRDRQELAFDNVRFRQGRKMQVVRLRVKPLLLKDRVSRGVRLVFIEPRKVTAADARDVQDFTATNTATQRIADLEQELVYSKESLQATIEELETSNEELQATNEELLASNEELQSTNEELQSLNEELHTVNTENQNRIEELTELTNDINNLLATSRVATMLVDSNLRIRRMSTAFHVLTSLKSTDMGAPLEVLSRDFQAPELIDLAQQVAEGAAAQELLVHPAPGRSVLVRLAPYKTETDVTKGLVVTVIDLTERKDRESMVQAVIDATAAHMAIVDQEGVILFTNEPWRRFRRHKGGDHWRGQVGENYWDVCRRAVDVANTERWLASLASVLRHSASHAETEYRLKSGLDDRWFLATATALPGERAGLVITQLDITQRKQYELQQRRGAQQVASSAHPMVLYDLSGRVTGWNLGAERLMGWSADEVLGAPLERFVPPGLQPAQAERHASARAGRALPCAPTQRLTRSPLPVDVKVSVSPVLDEDGKVSGISEVLCECGDACGAAGDDDPDGGRGGRRG